LRRPANFIIIEDMGGQPPLYIFMPIKELRAKYGKNKKSRQLYNAAIRAECPGGGELLDLLELVSSMRGRVSSADEASKLQAIEDRLQLIRERMFYDVRDRWEIKDK